MSISESKLTFNRKRIIILIIYILITITLNYLLKHSSFIINDIQKRIAYVGGFIIGTVCRWATLIVFFLMNENLVSKFRHWKRKGIRLVSILLVLIIFNSFIEPFSFTIDYFVIWLILNKGFRTKKTLENGPD